MLNRVSIGVPARTGGSMMESRAAQGDRGIIQGRKAYWTNELSRRGFNLDPRAFFLEEAPLPSGATLRIMESCSALCLIYRFEVPLDAEAATRDDRIDPRDQAIIQERRGRWVQTLSRERWNLSPTASLREEASLPSGAVLRVWEFTGKPKLEYAFNV